jgi:hypothetical protein
VESAVQWEDSHFQVVVFWTQYAFVYLRLTAVHVSFMATALGLEHLSVFTAVINKLRNMFLRHISMSLSRFAASNSTADTRRLFLDDDVVGYAPGDMVPWHFMPTVIVASFFASLSGTLLTTELLQRRRLGKSLMSRQAPPFRHGNCIADLYPEYTFLLVH